MGINNCVHCQHKGAGKWRRRGGEVQQPLEGQYNDKGSRKGKKVFTFSNLHLPSLLFPLEHITQVSPPPSQSPRESPSWGK